MVKNPLANWRYIREVGLIPGLGKSPGGGHGNPLQYSCLENLVERGAWRAVVHWVASSPTQLLWLSREQHPLTRPEFYLSLLIVR